VHGAAAAHGAALSPHREIVVDECEVIGVSTAAGDLAIGEISFEYTRGEFSSDEIVFFSPF
jgi:hypothetical protein